MSQTVSPVADRAPAITPWNADYIEELYRQWQSAPESLPETWRAFFQGFEMAMCPRTCVASVRAHQQSQVASLIYAYRSQGHLIAKTDPLGNDLAPLPLAGGSKGGCSDSHPDLDPANFGFTDADRDTVFDTGHLGGPSRASLKEIIQILRDTYCGSIGVQYIHIQDTAIRRWLQAQMEPIRNRPQFSREAKREILHCLNDAELFETFIQTKYPGHKRFSLEGAETLIPAIHALVELAPELGVREIVVGMSHRGRLNVLANILDKSYDLIFTEFEDYIAPDSYGGDGDVKYHLGFSSTHNNRSGKPVHLSLTANPSHLEASDPVVLGRTRAKQRQSHKVKGGSFLSGEAIDRRPVLPLLIHGDAAFAGQGLVAETLNLSHLKGYQTGGTVHFIVNNQIGFTTDPRDARSTAYCTDVALMIEAPVFHVNGDDPETVVYVTELALKFRQEFRRDVVIDMVCYRRHGHNEGDEPAFTQPLMYKKIKDRPSARRLYTQQLVEQKEITPDEVERLEEEYREKLQGEFDRHKTSRIDFRSHAADPRWSGLDKLFSHETVATAVSRKALLQVAQAINQVPAGFHLNPKIARLLPERLKAVEQDGATDWAFAEALAFGTLLLEGTPVRLSGQDSKRGTFSQRHAEWRDTESDEPFIPLNHISPTQAGFCVYNSPLSEASVLGFDYGYSLAEPRMLIMWEAQFGDFANGAQTIIDQFIISSQSKWQRTSGLVMLLPHGYEGQGPEHSNGYLERYLSACAQDNIQVCNLTTPAQYFHALRRQMKRPFRRPLIVMAPKSMLRHPRAVSRVRELVDVGFQEIIDDPQSPSQARRMVLCTGKLYYDLVERREQDKVDDVALVRIEQLYPISSPLMKEIAARYSGILEIIWAQEEPKNRGAWTFIRPWLQYLFPHLPIRYVGRGYAASPATGSLIRHKQEQEHIVTAAIHAEAVPHDVSILPESIGVEAL